MTSGKREAAEAINAYFINKVDTLQAAALADPTRDLANLASESVDMARDVSHPATETANSASNAANPATDVADLAREPAKPKSEAKRDFEFTIATAGSIAKIIRGLKSTEAMGIDNNPTSILKKGVEFLAGPISNLVNRLLAEGCVPKAFKVGKVFPVYKGKRNFCEDPASYRPVSIVPAMSKVLETSVKSDLEKHLARVDGLPGPSTAFGPRGLAPPRWGTRTPGGSTTPRGGRSLPLWPSNCPPPSIGCGRAAPTKTPIARSVWEGSRLVRVLPDWRQPTSVLGQHTEQPHGGQIRREAREHPWPGALPCPHQRHGQGPEDQQLQERCLRGRHHDPAGGEDRGRGCQETDGKGGKVCGLVKAVGPEDEREQDSTATLGKRGYLPTTT
jgi:hypothetical protein